MYKGQKSTKLGWIKDDEEKKKLCIGEELVTESINQSVCNSEEETKSERTPSSTKNIRQVSLVGSSVIQQKVDQFGKHLKEAVLACISFKYERLEYYKFKCEQ